MTGPPKILIVEDEMIIGANISLHLSTWGYEVSGIVSRGEEALMCIHQNKPDILLLDIHLKGNIDGVQTAMLMRKDFDIPFIFLTDPGDEVNLNRAKAARPCGLIFKPFKKTELKQTIELVIHHHQPAAAIEDDVLPTGDFPFILDDCIFVRHQEKMVKVTIQDILFIEAERNYCRLYTKGREHLLVMTLKEMDEKLPQRHFLRIHRSFIVNVSQIDEIATSHVVIAKKAIPLSTELRKQLLLRIQKL